MRWEEKRGNRLFAKVALYSAYFICAKIALMFR